MNGPRVNLIIPPSVFLLDERVFMSLGILKVAAVLEKAGHPVEVLDLSGIQDYVEVARFHARQTHAEVFGMTATTPQMPAVRRIVEAVRTVRPEARMVLGGPHPTLVHAAFRNERKKGVSSRGTDAMNRLLALFDVVVVGDGEEAVFEALRPDPPKLIDADDARSPLFQSHADFDAHPLPARHLVDVESYRYYIDGERALSLITQLGCPFACGFCGGRETAMLRRIRKRSAESVMAELRHLHEDYHVKAFMLYDDELNVNAKLFLEVLSRIIRFRDEHGVDLRFRGFIKSELFNEAQARSMVDAGFRWILVGFESGADRILTNINKKAAKDENTRCLDIAHKYGLRVKALMSIGHPGESPETIEETHRWLAQVGPDDLDVSIITTYPGTPYYDEAVPDEKRPGTWIYTYAKTGDRLYAEEVDYTEVADYYKGNPDGGYRSFVFTEALSADQLVKARDFIERDIRKRLGIPFYPASPSIRYEHSMGQMGRPLPPNILRSSDSEPSGPITPAARRGSGSVR